MLIFIKVKKDSCLFQLFFIHLHKVKLQNYYAVNYHRLNEPLAQHTIVCGTVACHKAIRLLTIG